MAFCIITASPAQGVPSTPSIRIISYTSPWSSPDAAVVPEFDRNGNYDSPAVAISVPGTPALPLNYTPQTEQVSVIQSPFGLEARNQGHTWDPGPYGTPLRLIPYFPGGNIGTPTMMASAPSPGVYNSQRIYKQPKEAESATTKDQEVPDTPISIRERFESTKRLNTTTRHRSPRVLLSPHQPSHYHPINQRCLQLFEGEDFFD